MNLYNLRYKVDCDVGMCLCVRACVRVCVLMHVRIHVCKPTTFYMPGLVPTLTMSMMPLVYIFRTEDVSHYWHYFAISRI